MRNTFTNPARPIIRSLPTTPPYHGKPAEVFAD
jgi:hypothetical protein